MKNIHILPTEKPSRLVKFFTNKFHLCKEILPIQDEEQYQNIYITSEEGIKEGDKSLLFIEGFEPIILTHFEPIEQGYEGKKIILTTDPDLIKDGVQAIDDEFLEWFVKNPSCKYVEWRAHPIGPNGNVIGTNKSYPFDGLICNFKIKYKIIIPQEEQRQHIISIMKEDEELGLYEESKQETLEEAAEKYKYNPKGDFCFTKGANWQAERMFEIMDAYVNDVMGGCNLRAKDWFSQFKKK
jgi:hypothetical protein